LNLDHPVTSFNCSLKKTNVCYISGQILIIQDVSNEDVLVWNEIC